MEKPWRTFLSGFFTRNEVFVQQVFLSLLSNLFGVAVEPVIPPLANHITQDFSEFGCRE